MRIYQNLRLRDIHLPQYTAHATARGQGRDGEVKSNDDEGLTLRLAMPQSLGGKGDGQNPEMLFAMGYAGTRDPSSLSIATMLTLAACLLSAIQMVSNQFGKTSEAKNAVVHTQVHLGKPNGADGYALEVEIQVEGVDQELIDAGHEVSDLRRVKNDLTTVPSHFQACPYSRALSHGAVVKVSKKN